MNSIPKNHGGIAWVIIAKNVVTRSKILPGRLAILRPITRPRMEYPIVPVVKRRTVRGSLSRIIMLTCFVPLALVMKRALPKSNVNASIR